MTEILDFLILAWLVGTWFYEGHHRRCTVIVTCDKCGCDSSAPCCTARKPLPRVRNADGVIVDGEGEG